MNCSRCTTPIAVTGAMFCPRCGARLSDRDTTTADSMARDFPWDTFTQDERPLRVLVATVTEALFHPSRFYRNAVSHSERLAPALLYACITGGLGLSAAWVWSRLLFPDGAASSVIRFLPDDGIVSPATLAMAPFLLLLQLLFTTGYIFVVLRLSRFKQCGFSRLLRLICYTETPMLLQAVPVFGSFLSTLLWLYALLTMLRFLFEGSRIKILFILLLPLVLLFSLLLVIVLAGLFGGIIAGAGILPDWKSLLNIL